jgi:hypothetical protein
MGKAKTTKKAKKKRAKKGEEPLSITALEVENVLRLKCVRLTLDGRALVIEGGNEQGKSSLLRVVDILMAGKDAKTAKDPIHADADKGHIVGTFGDYIVRKDFTRGKSPVLTITNKVGRKLSAPQTILAGFLKYISLDISKFMEMSDREQVATLSEVMGFDSKEFDADHQRIYDARRDANRDVKRLTAQLSGLECDPTAPTDEVSVSELTKELSDIEQSNSEIQTAIRERNALANELAGAKEELADLEARVRSIKADIKARASALKSAEAEIKGRDVQDTAPIYEKIAAADAINEAVRAKARRQEVADELADAEKNAAEIQAALDEVESKREAARMKARAKLPLPELDITEDAVLYKGKPLSQAGSSAQLRVSVAIAIGLNRESRCKLLLIDDAEKLEAKNIEMVLEMAKDAGFDVWMTRVLNRPGEESAGSVVIEDGTLQA